jgi:hypothetical protein
MLSEFAATKPAKMLRFTPKRRRQRMGTPPCSAILEQERFR